MLAARHVTRRFGPLLALDAVDFDARPGEIVALLGENGAGKTTLMNILGGRLRPDAGSIELFGRALRPGSPAAALAAGVAAVHQSPMLFERMTWEENLALGGFGAGAARSGRTEFTIDLKEVAARAAAMAARLGFALPPPGVRMEQRSMAERVRMEVLRALSFDPRVLILDEPTGLLAPVELTAFLDVLRRLRAEGRIVILVTHKLAEALAVADRITVLRRGRVAARRARGEVTEDELATLMIGELAAPSQGARTKSAVGAVALEVKDLVVERDGWRALDGVSFEVAAGEIVGIAGVDGNGQSELVEAMAGVRRPVSGSIRAGAAGVEDRGGGGGGDRDHSGEPRPRRPRPRHAAMGEPAARAPAARARVRAFRMAQRVARVPRYARSCSSAFISGPPARRRSRPSFPAATVSACAWRARWRAARACWSRIISPAGSTLPLPPRCVGCWPRSPPRAAQRFSISSDLDELIALCGRLAVISRGRLRAVGADERDPARLGLLMAGAS